MPHPESANKFIQCTKRGEMFIFNCQNANFVWNEQTNKCEKPVEREAKMLFFKSKSKNLGQKLKFLSSQLNTDSDENETSMDNPEATTSIPMTMPIPTSNHDNDDDVIISKIKNLNEQQKLNKTVSFHTTTEAPKPITTTTVASAPTSTSTTPATTTTTTEESTTVETTILEMNVTDSLGEVEDSLIIATILQHKIEDASSRKEQELLRQQLEKQELLIKQSTDVENEIIRQHLIDNHSKLKQQLDEQKEIVKQKLSNPNLENSAELSVSDIQNLVHSQEMTNQRHELELQHLEQQKHEDEMKLLEKQHLEDQAIIQTLFNLKNLDRIHSL
jgi:hypothetical protein